MKTTTRILLASLFSAVSASALSAQEAQLDSRAEVVFVNPEKFTDVKDSYMGSDRAREDYLNRLKEHFQKRAADYIPEGTKLIVNVSDVDMAGDFEPWRGPQASDVRIVRDIYPPRIQLSYQLVDATGRVLQEGERRTVSDLAFMSRVRINNDDPLRYEKELVDDWYRNEFRRQKSR